MKITIGLFFYFTHDYYRNVYVRTCVELARELRIFLQDYYVYAVLFFRSVSVCVKQLMLYMQCIHCTSTCIYTSVYSVLISDGPTLICITTDR